MWRSSLLFLVVAIATPAVVAAPKTISRGPAKKAEPPAAAKKKAKPAKKTAAKTPDESPPEEPTPASTLAAPSTPAPTPPSPAPASPPPVQAAAAKPQREVIALFPFQGGSLGDAWMPLLAQLVDERGREPALATKLPPALRYKAQTCRAIDCARQLAKQLGATKVIAGSYGREGARYFLALSLYDDVGETKVDRSWVSANAAEAEIGVALDQLLSGKTASTPVAIAPAPTTATGSSEPPVALQTTAAPLAPVHRFRTPATAFTVVGALIIAGGGGMMIANRLMLPVLVSDAARYNTGDLRTNADYARLQGQQRAVDALLISSYVAFGLGAAALATGIALFAVDGTSSASVSFVPAGPGGSLVGNF